MKEKEDKKIVEKYVKASIFSVALLVVSLYMQHTIGFEITVIIDLSIIMGLLVRNDLVK